MMNEWIASIRMLLAMTALTGIAYPAVVTVISQAAFPNAANGSLLYDGDRVVGSQWIGQSFASDRYFWGRPSATAPAPYNAASSSGSNLGPLNEALARDFEMRAVRLRATHPEQARCALPVDLLCASGSGLDPHITPAAAVFQVERIAKARRIAAESVRALVERNVEPRTLGILGEPRVNVLMLNRQLDTMH